MVIMNLLPPVAIPAAMTTWITAHTQADMVLSVGTPIIQSATTAAAIKTPETVEKQYTNPYEKI